MTRDEILKLEGLELRKAVARIRGWMMMLTGDGFHAALLDGSEDTGFHNTDKEAWDDVPHFESEIAAAWTLALEFSEQKNKNFSLSHSNVTDKWTCIICESERRPEGGYTITESGMGEGTTAPQAICRAYLMVKGMTNYV